MNAAPSRFGTFWQTVKSWTGAETLRNHEDKVLLVLTLIIGAVVGLVVVAFILVTENLGARMYPPGGAAWRRLAIPVAGALITGFLLLRYFPNARGSGIPQTKTALFLRGGIIRFRTVVGKFACSSLSLASGIALGREGPAVQVGAGIASCMGQRLGLSPSRVKALVPIGAAAALAAAFNTPIAAVLFTLEEVMGDMHAPVLGSIVLSSATSWMVLHLLLGDEPLFHAPAYQLVHPLEFAFYAVLGLAGGLVSVGFVKLLLWQRKQFLRLPPHTRWLQPAAGGLLVGILGWFVPEVLGVGYGFVSRALNGQIVFGMMALLVLLKLVATATCYASGNAGGIFGPSLFIGAMLGGAVGAGAHLLLPDYTGSVGAYALVGMGTAFAGIVRVPLTSVIMIFEVTRDYSIIVPLMISNLISYFISSRLQAEPIYEALQHQDGIHLPPGARGREEPLPVSLGAHPPEQVLAASESVEEAAGEAIRKLEAWPVIGNGALLGMLKAPQLDQAMMDGRAREPLAALLPPAVPEDELDFESFPHVHSDDSLDTAMRLMAQAGLKVLPVVSRANLRELVGVISLGDIMAAYGLETGRPRAAEAAGRDTRAPAATAIGAIAALVAVVVIAGFLSYFYRTHRMARAQQFFQQGNELVEAGRYQEAIEPYRNALSISQNSQHRLALALALVKAGRSDEGRIYLDELLRENPNSGPANLGMGRALVQENRIQQALASYHRAIYGSWPKDAAANRVEARLELVDALGKAGARKQAQAELLTLVSETPSGVAGVRKRVGGLLLAFGLAKESAGVFRDVLRKNKADSEAQDGLGEAELELGEFAAAESAFRDAARLEPGNQTYQARLRLAEQVLAMDPAVRGLSAAGRYQRSRKLREAAEEALDRCLAANTAAHVPDSIRSLADAARKTQPSRERPRFYAEDADSNSRMAGQLWDARMKMCGPPAPADEALSRAMAQLSR